MSDETKPQEWKHHREIVYWDCDDDAETLNCETIDEAIEEHFGGLPPPKDDLNVLLKVHGWARTIVTPASFPAPLDLMMECLFENDESCLFGECDDIEEKITPAMKEAEKVFLEVVAREFRSWACEVVETRAVNVRKWIAAHKPEWATASET